MFKVGISTCGDKPLTTENLKLMKDSGLDFIEISRGSYKGFDYKKVFENCKESNINIWSLHLPFTPFDEIDPSSLNSDIREYSFKLHSEIIVNASNIGVNKFVLHPSIEPIYDNDREVRLNNSMEYASRLADFAAKYECEIAIEVLPRTCLGNCSDEILRFLNYNEKLRVCFDTNHLLGENIVDFIKSVGDKIITLHVSDYDFINERHWLPGEGDIDWKTLYSELLKVGYNGVWMYEINLQGRNTINRRLLEYKDFYNNANEIFSYKNPTAIGKRVENLGLWGPK